MQNPFNPFGPLAESIHRLAGDRTILVERIIARLAEPHAAFSIAAGGMGVGKTTLLRGSLASRLRADGWHPIVLVASSDLTSEELLLQVAANLGLGVPNVLHRLGLDRTSIGEQATGKVVNSSGVAIVQTQLAVERQEGRIAWGSIRTASALQELARLANVRIAVLLDQAEHLFLGPNAEKAILLMEALVRAASTSAGSVCSAIALREEFLHYVLALAGAFPNVTSGIVAIGGLEPPHAAHFVTTALTQYGASFSKGLVDLIIHRLSGFAGTVWPVALHACCKPLAELSKNRGRTASVRDLNALGDLSGILGKVVADAVRAADPPFADDAIYGLYVLSDLCQREGLVRLERISQSLPAFPLEDVVRIIRLLKALRLIEEPRTGQIRLAHDALAAAVFGLRHGTQNEDEIRTLDRAVAEWGINDTLMRREEVAFFVGRVPKRLPTPHLAVLAASLFQARSQITEEWVPAISFALRQAESRHVIRLVVEHITRQGIAPAMRPHEIFVLATIDASEALATAMTGLIAAASGPGTHWAEAEYCDAIRLAGPVGLGNWLRDAESLRLPPSVLRCIVRVLLQERQVPLAEEVFLRIWEHAADVAKPELLALAVMRFPDTGGRMALDCVSSDVDYLRAAAADVSSCVGRDVGTQIVKCCLADSVPAVRRRAAFAIGSRQESSSAGNLMTLLRSDPSPLVREASLEMLAHFDPTDQILLEVQGALNDPFDFVRESAVYALAHLLPAADAAEAVASCSLDPSPKVREAVLRLAAAAQSSSDIAAALQDLRVGPTGLRVAAAEALAYIVNDDVDIALDQVLHSSETEREALLATLQTVGRRKSALCVPSVVSLLSSADVGIVCEGIIALTAIGGPAIVPQIAACAFHVSVDVRERVVYALGELGGKESVAVLTACLSDPREEIRVRAIYALGRLGATEAAQRVKLVSLSGPQSRAAIDYFFEQIQQRLRREDGKT
jgi:HEAT repeat protein